MRFRSKIDWWLAAVLAISIVAPLVGVVRSGELLVLLPVGLAALLVLSTVLGTYYVITESALEIRCGVFRMHVPLHAITSLRATRNPLSAPALSLDRIDVEYRGGHALISPRDRDGFIAAVRERVPAVEVDGLPGGTAGDTARSNNTRVAVLVFASLAVALTFVVGVLVGGSRPPTVEIVPGRVTVGNALATASFAPAEVASVSLEERWPDVRRRLRGFAGGDSLRGRFRLEGLGDGYVFAERGRPFVLVRTRDSFVLIGFRDATRTRRTYDDLRRLPAR